MKRKENKPTICGILNVEVEQPFQISEYDDNVVFFIREDGTYATEPENAQSSSHAIMRAIQHPEMVHKCCVDEVKWTPMEIQYAKVLKETLDDADRIHMTFFPVVDLTVEDRNGNFVASLYSDCFPTLTQCVPKIAYLNDVIAQEM